MESKTFIHRFYRAMNQFPERHALFVKGSFLTYGEFGSLVKRIAQQLVLQENQSDIVAIHLNDDCFTYASLVAVMSVGKAYLPLSEQVPIQRNGLIVKEAEATIILSAVETPWLQEFISKAPVSLKHVSEESCTEELLFPEDYFPEPEDLAYLIYTSGSTGNPKGVPLRHINVNGFLKNLLENEFDLNEHDRYIQMFNLTFDFSVMSTFLPFSSGACLYAVPQKGVKLASIIELLLDYNITVSPMVPSILVYLKPYFEQMQLPHMRYCFLGGEAVHNNLVEGFAPCIPNAKIYNFYGPTEAAVFVSKYRWDPEVSPDEAVNGIVPIGKAFEDMDLYVLQEDGNRGYGQEKGEMILEGKQVIDGYWKNPERNAESFIDGKVLKSAYKTGDICYFNENENIIYVGRKDHQLKIDGYRVELSDLEHNAASLPHVEMAVAAAQADQNGHQVIFLFVKGSHINLEVLRQQLSDRVPSYMVPKEIIPIHQFPTNKNGKIDRFKLMKDYKS